MEKVIVVAVQMTQTDEEFAYALEEMERLVDTAKGKVIATLTQKRERYDGRTMIGKGKVDELRMLVDELQPDLVIFYQSLTASVVRNLQEEITVRIIDRVQLILDIFAMRATSKEGKLQVELAQLNYLLPRLMGQGTALSRLGGGIGTRGPGETKLESDKRHIRRQIRDIEHQLADTENHRKRAREKRQNSSTFQFGLIGYTNAGKSTLLNRLTQAGTYEEDQLFATLDPLTRKLDLEQAFEATITDTVGFIQDLPTTLIHAFQSTLEESRGVDLLIHVVDASNEQFLQHEQTVHDLLVELDMEKIPMITIYNKMDKAPLYFQANQYPSLQISANDVGDIERTRNFLIEEMKKNMSSYQVVLEAHQQQELNKLQRHSYVEEILFNEETNQYIVNGYKKK